MTEPFDIIVADPPWRSDFGVSCSRATERHYPTMNLEAICDYPVPAANDALLFLWATAPMLPKSLRVMTRWGFEYRTGMVWCKDRMGTGKWVRSQHEHVLIGRRGHFPAPAPFALPASVLHAPRTRHSEKPEVLQDIIERLWPGRRYLELFARRERSGWTVRGNQVETLPLDAA